MYQSALRMTAINAIQSSFEIYNPPLLFCILRLASEELKALCVRRVDSLECASVTMPTQSGKIVSKGLQHV